MNRSLTDNVWAKLSDLGKKRLKEYTEIYHLSYELFEKQDGWYEFQFSHLMVIFGGRYLDDLSGPPFVDNEVHFDKPF